MVIPIQDGLVMISIWNCRAHVSRQKQIKPGQFTIEVAANWEELEDEAIEVIHEQGAAINISGQCWITPELAAKAVWEE